MEFWKRLSHFLSNRELEQVMGGVASGKDLLRCHEELGVFQKYQLEILKLIQTLSQVFEERISYPIL